MSASVGNLRQVLASKAVISLLTALSEGHTSMVGALSNVTDNITEPLGK